MVLAIDAKTGFDALQGEGSMFNKRIAIDVAAIQEAMVAPWSIPPLPACPSKCFTITLSILWTAPARRLASIPGATSSGTNTASGRNSR